MKTLITKRILHALFIAIRVHGTSRRKGDGKPYLIHPIAVFRLLRKWGADEDTQIAGILHDVLEDAPEHKKGKYRAKIQKSFGEKVLETVEGVTEQDKSLSWKERKKLYLEHLQEASQGSLLVSCADLTHNLAAIVQAYKKQGEDVWKHFNASKEDKIWSIEQRTQILIQRLAEKYTKELISNHKDLNALLSKSNTAKARYTVYVDDNFHYMDESERYKHGETDNLGSAIGVCKQIVDKCLQDIYKDDMSADELYMGYTCMGSDPYIIDSKANAFKSTEDLDPIFSAWTYAKERAKEMCKERILK